MSQVNLKSDISRLIAGSVSEDPALLATVSGDFGGIVRKEPALLVQPRDAAEVAKVLGFANKHGVPVSARAGGYSFAGQSLSQGGIVLDLRELRGLASADPDQGTFEALAATPWKDVVAAGAQMGFIPPVLTSFMGATVGGTLSAAGFGMSSAYFGTQADHCIELEVALAEGELVRCSQDQHRDLFEHVLCGFGQFGFITRARMAMRPAAKRVRTYFLQYDDLGAHLADQVKLVQEKRVAYIDGMVRPCLHGLKMLNGRRVPLVSYLYPLNITVEIDEERGVDDEAVLSGLNFSKWIYAEEMSLADFLLVGHSEAPAVSSRLVGIFVDVLIPWADIEDFLHKIEAHVFPTISYIEHTLMWPMTRDTLKRPLLRTPDAPMFMGIGLYCRVSQGLAQATLNSAQAFVDLARRAGGAYYLSGSVRLKGARDFEGHFGEIWPTICQAKYRYDPQGILNPGVFAFQG